MKAKDLIKALQRLDPESNVIINIKQSSQVWGKQVPIEYGNKANTDNADYNESCYLGQWVNQSYGGSITVHLPDGAYIAKWPK